MECQGTEQFTQTPTNKYVGYFPIKNNPPIKQVVHLPDFEGYYTFTPMGDLFFNCERKGAIPVKINKYGKFTFNRKGYFTFRYPAGMFLKYFWPNIQMDNDDYWIKGFEGIFSYNVSTHTVWRWEAQKKHPIVQNKNPTRRVILWVKQKQYSVNLKKAVLVVDYRE